MKRHTETEMLARRERLIAVASGVFFRYGYARTTLGDIAQAASLHRPALYALFPNGKDELFEAVLLHLVESEVQRYRKDISTFKTTREKLSYCVERWSMGGYRLTETQPDARDAFNMAYPAVRKMYEVLTSFYAEILNDAVQTSSFTEGPYEIARLLIFSLRGIKDIAGDAETLHRLINLQIDVFLTALREP